MGGLFAKVLNHPQSQNNDAQHPESSRKAALEIYTLVASDQSMRPAQSVLPIGNHSMSPVVEPFDLDPIAGMGNMAFLYCRISLITDLGS